VIADLLLTGGTVVNHDGAVRAELVVTDGTISGVLAPGSAIEARQVIDVTGKHLFPGAVDPHAHITNRRPLPESIARETASLALGGTTTVLDFLATETSYHELAPEAIAAIDLSSYVDFGLHAVVQNALHVHELPEYAREHGITSSKMYMGAADWRLYPTTVGIHDGLVFQTLKTVAAMGPRARAMVHAENWEIASVLQQQLQDAGRTDAAAWTESRPNLCEVDCLQRIALLAREANCPIYGVHLTTREAPEILLEARAAGVDFAGETCPHYLMIHKDHPRALLAKYNPAIKAAEDSEALWAGLADGSLDCVGSDHIPVRLPEKLHGADSIWTARGGVPGSGTILPLLISEGILRRGLPPERVAAVTSTNAARIFGLYPRKGSLTVGADADIVVSDFGRRTVVEPGLLGLDFTLFDGEQFGGWPEMTLLRGRVIADNGRLEPDASGRYLRRTL
jgi:dihydroorotase-like cyclic amidohydrolase